MPQAAWKFNEKAKPRQERGFAFFILRKMSPRYPPLRGGYREQEPTSMLDSRLRGNDGCRRRGGVVKAGSRSLWGFHNPEPPVATATTTLEPPSSFRRPALSSHPGPPPFGHCVHFARNTCDACQSGSGEVNAQPPCDEVSCIAGAASPARASAVHCHNNEALLARAMLLGKRGCRPLPEGIVLSRLPHGRLLPSTRESRRAPLSGRIVRIH